MTIHEKLRKSFIRRLKDYKCGYYNIFYNEYKSNADIKFLCDSLFKSYNPFYILHILHRKSSLPYDLLHKILDDFNDIFKNNKINYHKIANYNFKAETLSDKRKLYNFCIKYGIIIYTLYDEKNDLHEYLKNLIKNNTAFCFDSDLELHCVSDLLIDKKMNEIFYFFEKEVNRVNGIKPPFFKRIFNKIKYGY